MRLYISGLDFRVDEKRVETLFAAYHITPLSFVIARNSERQSLGYGFMNVADFDVDPAIKLTGKMIEAKKISVAKARK